MTRSYRAKYRLFAGCTALTFVIVGLAASVGHAQVGVKTKPLPSQAVVKSGGNVLAQFPLGAAGKLQRDLVNLTNKARQQAGLKPLVVKRVLTSVAQRHALNMASKDMMSHTLDGKNVSDRLKDAGYNYSWCGENIAFRTNSTTAEEVFNGWMNSPGHRANILNPNFTEISIGVAMNGRTMNRYFCQVFGTPR